MEPHRHVTPPLDPKNGLNEGNAVSVSASQTSIKNRVRAVITGDHMHPPSTPWGAPPQPRPHVGPARATVEFCQELCNPCLVPEKIHRRQSKAASAWDPKWTALVRSQLQDRITPRWTGHSPSFPLFFCHFFLPHHVGHVPRFSLPNRDPLKNLLGPTSRSLHLPTCFLLARLVSPSDGSLLNRLLKE